LNCGFRSAHKTKEVNEDALIDYDKEGNIIGIELLFIKKD